ncbi:hypothetical protein TRFO_21440 [Tritrichomonas foetus]|uniref:SP-RING-type domain-containing protein n=1 Tax=Tritrichomonas foetus TaxID=1144522 RepID=A0A1J4KIX0_9EUKA|nr:hypothetical protein TRFO_21440 [Tritrichomonas foetus]|eukprot:OHT09630.1 hypothetical protein TRFO_21440 [Tritrichomonas foetus]
MIQLKSHRRIKDQLQDSSDQGRLSANSSPLRNTCNSINKTFVLCQKSLRKNALSDENHDYNVHFSNYSDYTFPTVCINGRLFDINTIVYEIVHKKEHAPYIPDVSRLSDTCPYSLNIITCPARSFLCMHSQCFDLRSFLLLQNDESWFCPICHTPMPIDSIRFDPNFWKNVRKTQNSDKLPNNKNFINKATDDCFHNESYDESVADI